MYTVTERVLRDWLPLYKVLDRENVHGGNGKHAFCPGWDDPKEPHICSSHSPPFGIGPVSRFSTGGQDRRLQAICTALSSAFADALGISPWEIKWYI